jgi:adenine-specific DNA methylase
MLATNDPPLDPAEPAHQNVLRYALLDFIADFANWDNSTVPAYLETSRALTQAAHEALGGEPGTRPLVVDPFAGGGSIPLEALRVGADAFASDLNPVAVLLNKVVLEYIPRYGQKLADEVRKWGQWIKEQAEKKLAEFYPKDPDGATPIAYLWARTIRCEGAGCGAEVPLLRSLWLAKKANKSVALKIMPNPTAKRVDFEIIQDAKAKEVGDGTVKRGSATCPCCGYTTPVKGVREQLKKRHGGAADARLLCVVTTVPNTQGRCYRLPNKGDLEAVANATTRLEKEKRCHCGPLAFLPEERFTGIEPRRIPVPLYGIDRFCDLFSPRQLVSLLTFSRLIQETEAEGDRSPDELSRATQLGLAFSLDKLADLGNSLCPWEPIAECPRHLFARQAMPMTWDFAEAVPTSESSGSWSILIDRFVHVLQEVGCDWSSSTPVQASATRHPLPEQSAQALVTDPPYYYSVPYADLSDFFYVWLRRTVGNLFPDLLHESLTPKDDECVQNLPHADVAHLQKSRQFYEDHMRLALSAASQIVVRSGVGVVVFAHSETEAWESLLKALIEAGWKVTASWPIDTEMGSRILSQRQRTLASSIHLVHLG